MGGGFALADKLWPSGRSSNGSGRYHWDRIPSLVQSAVHTRSGRCNSRSRWGIAGMIPDSWHEVALNTSPHFLEEIGFFGTVPSGHPISVLAAAKNGLRDRLRRKLEKIKIPRQRFCILYYAGHDPRACDGKIDIDVEWWGPCQEIFSIVQNVY